MRTRTLLTLALTVVLLVAALAGPAAARKNDVSLIGRGTWTALEDGRAFQGPSTGTPLEGTTSGTFTAVDGALPPWPGCTPGEGTVTTTDGTHTLVLRIWGDLCQAVHPSADLVLIGWYDVVSYDGARGRRVPDGRGSIDIRSFDDGTLQWMITGQLY